MLSRAKYWYIQYGSFQSKPRALSYVRKSLHPQLLNVRVSNEDDQRVAGPTYSKVYASVGPFFHPHPIHWF